MGLRKSTEERLQDLKKKKERVPLGGGQKRIEKQHEAGKLTARERIDLIVDKGSFQELGVFVTHR
ncbi:MAG: carboxyl transferase domain-containing protein, partial [bacterium]